MNDGNDKLVIPQAPHKIPKWSRLLKEWRLELGETQTEFGARWGVGKGVVSLYENGYTKPGTTVLLLWLKEGGERGLEIANQMLYQ